jgi:4-amino-4-deoxy-L-arabinose transferase-like glycosyltransferase
LALVWLAVWVGGFSAAATKLPNYVLPAYPAAAFLVAIIAVDAARRAATGHWPHPRWMATGLASLAFGGVATAVTVIVATRYGIPGAEAAAAVGIVPIIGTAACWALATRRPLEAVAAFTVISRKPLKNENVLASLLKVHPSTWGSKPPEKFAI